MEESLAEEPSDLGVITPQMGDVSRDVVVVNSGLFILTVGMGGGTDFRFRFWLPLGVMHVALAGELIGSLRGNLACASSILFSLKNIQSRAFFGKSSETTM